MLLLKSPENSYFWQKICEELHEQKKISILLLLCLLVDCPPAHLSASVGADQGERVLVQEPALGHGEVAEDPLGRLAVELQDEFHDDGIVMIQGEEVNHRGQAGFEPGEYLMDSCYVATLHHTSETFQQI